ncbi:sensor histidine kinase [Capillimicrobium parvum]|uniref:histidine kinase n=1 Tax=Capillimicrobium parvum TaxID=2884022 RepID=A0A9E6XUN6_9ACTN|nr:HAMP domain-containing sensor histidine kinase [Capillimicrobium parvum]UGS34743.1 Adaptive-response sensory-kinase SasA [Capillimicrobium parvum]
MAVYFVLPRAGTAQSVVYVAIGLGGVAAILAGTARNRPERPWPWLLIAAAVLSFSVGDALSSIADSSPSVADAFYLAGYPLMAAGLVLLIAALPSAERVSSALDAAIVAVAFGLLQWVYLIEGAVNDPSWTTGDQVVSGVLYPAMDVLLLAALTAFFLGSSWRLRSFQLLGAGVLAMLVADEVVAVSSSYSSGSWLDALWLLSYVAWGAAGLHPSMRELSQPTRQPGRPAGFVRPLLLGAALLTSPAVMLVQNARDAPLHAVAVAFAGALMAVLVVTRFALIVRSVERLRAEQAARNEELVRASRLKDEFVALISHDLRTPLTSILGYLELAADPLSGPLTDDQRSYLQVVERNAQRLLVIINDLLFVARLQAGVLELDLAEQDLAAIAEQSVREARARASAKHIDIRFDQPSSPPVLVAADKGRMFQLLDNLLSNAIKFTPDDGAVTVSVDRRGETAELVVADTGIGISAEDQQQLFGRFFRASNAVDAQIPGTGLGLYIAREITHGHGGTITVDSEQQRGTRFTILLPAASG